MARPLSGPSQESSAARMSFSLLFFFQNALVNLGTRWARLWSGGAFRVAPQLLGRSETGVSSILEPRMRRWPRDLRRAAEGSAP